MDFIILKQIDLSNVKMICIEHDGKHVEMEQKLSSLGFRKILFNAENLIMVK